MNEQLESHHYNLAFAHETAGIRPWDWDIESQRLEITFSINKTNSNRRYSSQHDIRSYTPKR